MTRVPPLVLKTFATLALLPTITLAVSETCDKSQCPGPLRYYKDLNCTPVYKSDDACCPDMYDCSAIYGRSSNKCYVNDHEYNVDEPLRPEDANPCDIGCVCSIRYDGVASFQCAEVDCFYGPTTPGCYRKRSPDQCCSGEEVCLKEGEERAKCVVDGKTYLDGEYFKPESDPDLSCYCMPDYKGENVEPFCKKPAHPYCSPDFRHAGEVYNHCAPVYYDNQNPQTDCSVFSRCQSSNDTVIRTSESTDSPRLDGPKCRVGDMTMNKGDKLNILDCVLCVCETPPIPTCVRLSHTSCNEQQNA